MFNRLSDVIIKKRLDDFNKIDKKRGYIKLLSKMWKISHTQVRRFIIKYKTIS